MSITLNLNNAGDTGTTAFTEQTPVLLFSTATISTSGLTDSGLLGTGRVDTITIALASHTATMVLSLNPAATSTASANGVTVSYNSGTGTLTLTGSNESNANWQTILRGVQYNDTSDTPTTPTSVLVTARNTAAGGGTGTDTQNITVTAVNDAPTATNLSAAETYTEDTALNLTGIVASDVDSATITATLTLSNTAAGSLTTATSGAVTSTYDAGTGVWTAAGELADVNTLLAGVSFTPAANFNSDFTIATNISDGSLSVSGTKIMTGTAVNDAPAGSASATLAAGTEDVNYTVNAIDLLAGFTDVDAGDTLNISGLSVVSPDLGTTVINNPDGSFTISHPLNYNGPVTLSYNVIDDHGGSVAGSQSYTLAAANVNDAPTATNLSAAETYTEDTALNLTGIVASDVDSATITATLTLSNTAAGSLTTATSGAVTSTYDAGTGVWTAAGELADVNTLLAGVSFTPAANFNSDFTIATNISDGSLSVSGTKIMTGTAVNDAPAGSASATLAAGTEDVNYTVTAAALLAGFTDVDAGDTLNISGLSVVSPDLGTTVINNPDGSFTISHPLNYNGPVTLSYNVIDDHGGSVAGSQSYTLAAANVNDAPTATNLSAAETYTEDTALNLTGIVASDVDSATITATLTLSNTAAGSLTTATSGAVTSTYDAGTGVWTAAGELADVNTLLAGVSFTPAANFNSDFTIATNISDGSLSVSGTKIMTGTAVNDAPAGSASATLAAGTEDVNYTVTAAALLEGFTDVDAGDTLNISGLSVVSPDLGTTVINNPDGSFTISHPLNYNGPVTLSYNVIDDHGGSVPGIQSYTLAAANVNDAPTATNLSAAETYTEDTALNLTGIVASDVDSATITATLTLSNTAAGSLTTATSGAVTSTYDAGTGVWTAAGELADVNTLLAGVSFTPAANFNSDFTIATNISDGSLSVSGTKIMTGTAVNDAPAGSASATLAAGTEDVNYTVTAAALLEGFTDVDAGDTLNISGLSVVSPDLGTTVINNPDGSFTISHPLNYNGPVTLSYNVIDDHGGSVPGIQSYTLAAANVNDAPTATNLSAAETYTEDTALNLTGIVASDVDSATITATLTLSNTAAGSLTTATSGAVTSTYDAGTGVWTAAGELADVNTLLAGVSFTPAANFNSDFTIATNISDGSLSVSGTKIMTGTAVNDAPAGSASATLAAGTEDVNYTVTAAALLEGFTDVDAGDTLNISGLSVVSPDLGTTVINNPDGSFTISHPLNYNGPVTLSYNVIDDHGGSVPGIQSYTLAAVNEVLIQDTRINTYTTGEQDSPSIATLTNGGFVVTWESYGQDGTSDGIYGQRYDASGATQGAEFRVNTSTASNQAEPSVTALINGGYVVIWRSDSQTGIYGQRYDASGVAQGVEFRANSLTDVSPFEPSVAALTDGGFVVAWKSFDQSSGEYDIRGQRYDASGAAQDAEFIVNTNPTGDQESPSVAALNDGGFVVTWQSYDQVGDGSEYDIYGQRYDATGAASGEFLVNTNSMGNQESPSVAALNDGFVVTWQSYQQDGGEYGIYGQRYDSSGVVQGSEFIVNTDTSSNQLFSSVAALAGGGFVVTWLSNQQNGSSYEIYGQRYDATGNAQGTEFQISSNPVNSAHFPTVTGLADGGFVVGWTSFDLDGSGVFGKRYDAYGNEIDWSGYVNHAPALTGAQAILVAGTEDINYTVNAAALLEGFSDVDASNTLSISGLSADHGTVTENPIGTFTITHAANYNGPVVLSYNVIDGHGGSVAGSQSYTLAAVNDVPALTATQAVLDAGTENSPYTVTAAALLEGFTDVDAGDTLSISGLSVVSPDLGTTVINNPDGSFTISHPLNYNGPVTLSYNVIDDHGGSVAGSQSYTLSASVNHAPTLIVPLVDQAVKYDTLDWSYNAGLSFNDADISDSLSYSATLANGNPIPSWMHIDATTGLMTGSPGFNDRGTYALSITATDTHGSGVSAPLTVAVTAFDAGQILVSTNGDDILAGTLSNDTVTYAYAVAPVTASLAITAPQNTGGAGLDTLTSIDNLIGSDFNDILTGNTQKNVLDGGIGADALKGGAGDDTYIVDNAGDVITEYSGAGTDTVNSSVTYYLPNNVENLALMGALAINGVGNTLANTITGNAANNYLDGWRGADTLIGGAGDDTYIVDNAGDVIIENLNEGTDKVNSSVTYILSANVENLTLTGTLAINGTGNDLANTLIGNSAANLLDGGIGADALKGGAGDDTYIVDNAGDVITEIPVQAQILSTAV